MAKNKDKKKKEREKRVAQKKLAEAARRREIARQSGDTNTDAPRARKVMTAGVQQKPQVQTGGKPTVAHRRTGG